MEEHYQLLVRLEYCTEKVGAECVQIHSLAVNYVVFFQPLLNDGRKDARAVKAINSSVSVPNFIRAREADTFVLKLSQNFANCCPASIVSNQLLCQG